MTSEAVTTNRNMQRRRMTSMPWQKQVQDYDLNGPGIAGYYLDVVALMAAMCPMHASVRTRSGEFKRSDDPVLQVGVEAWRGGLMPQTDLQFAAVRGRESQGRIWHIKDPETGWNVVMELRQVDDKRVGWTDLYGRQRIVSKDAVFMSWMPHPYRPWEATSPMQRAIPDMKRLRSFLRNQNRSADSRLLTNGILNFPNDPTSSSHPFAGQGGPDQGDGAVRSSAPSPVDDFFDIAQLAHRDTEGITPATMAPFLYEGPRPEYIELGSLIDPTALEGETKAIEGFARSVNFPQQLLTMGPGSSNHWNEFLTAELAVKIFLAPKLNPICNDVADMHLRPMINQFRQNMQSWESVDPRHVKVEFDMSFLLRRPKMLSEMFEAYRLGLVTRDVVIAEAGQPKEALLAIPVGMSEYEHWETATGGKGAPYAETDADNNLIVADPNAGMMGAPTDPMADPNAPTDPAAQQDASSLVTEALGGAPGTPPADMGVTEPAPPVTAALPIDPIEETAAELFDDAQKQDAAVNAELAGVVAVIVAAAQAEVVRQIIIAHPARSETRKRLTSLPAEDVWDAADPEVKQSFDVNAVLEATIEKYRPQIEAVYEDAAETFLQKWGSTIAAVLVTAGIIAATDALVSGLYNWASGRFVRDGAWTGATLLTAAGRLAKPPASIVRESMTIAGGAQTDRNGRLLLDLGNNPHPATGGVWTGNSGWLTGHNVTSAAPVSPHAWKWHHSWFRTPMEPFPPHLALDGQVFDRPSDVPGGLYPGDHPQCSCSLLPTIHGD